MADGGNILTALGLDPQLITAGAAGGLIKSIVTKTKLVEAVGAMVVGSLMSNFFAATAVDLAASGVLLGIKLQVKEGVAGCFIAAFAFIIFDLVGYQIRSRFGGTPGGTP